MRARLIESREIAPEVRHFLFEAEGIARLDYTAGQFVSLEADCDGKSITRAYSLASEPHANNQFELCLNRVEHGRLSPKLFAMTPGDSIDMRPPLGMFTMRQPPRESLFIATGTGIAPFRAMLQAHLKEGSPAITLLFGVRYESHLMYRGEFAAMAKTFPRFRFWPTLSRPDSAWTGRTGHVQAHLNEALGGRRDLDVYLCGLKQMVDDARAIFKGLGFDRKQIFYEKYD